MTSTTRNRRWTVVGLAVLGLLGLTPVVARFDGGEPAHAVVAAPGDGTTSTTAGASCWGIKTQHPTSKDGVYWLSNASMTRPAQFFCDMTTDGGGWVLVGRGRDGWTFKPNGQGSAATVRSVVDGPSAFAPAALDTATITGLLGGTKLAANTDGIRLRRAVNASGAIRQEIRLFEKRDDWSWAFDYGQPLVKTVVNGGSYAGGQTRDSTVATGEVPGGALVGVQDSRAVWTRPSPAKANRAGFGLGSSVTGGSSAASNYLWLYGKEQSPLGFTQVYLRPRIANDNAGFTPIPAAGFTAETKPLSFSNRSERANWGVVGADHTNETSANPWYANVLAVEASGDRVFVGGRFTGVKNGPTGATTARKYLAAFDLAGNYIKTFTPTFDGRIWAIHVTANGKLIVGGDFTKVNGVARPGIVALNPLTGAIDTTWTASVGRVGTRAIVTSITSRGSTIYASGRFSTASGGTTKSVSVASAVSWNTTDGTVGTWRPIIHATAKDLEVSADGTRVLMAGYFAAVNNDTSMGFFGITDAVTGKPVAGYDPFLPSAGSGTATFQLGVTETPSGNLVIGGSQHSLQLYNAKRQRINGHITKGGGDFQFADMVDGSILAGCHCTGVDYQSTFNYKGTSDYKGVEPMRFIARYDPTTLQMDTSWYPDGLKGSVDDGPWDITLDRNKCLWLGGDFVRGAYSGNAATDWLGGFARFCPADHQAPTAPTGFTAAVSADGVKLAWKPATDASGSVSYDVYRDDRIIATVYGTSFTDTLAVNATGTRRYTVRASDVRGNRSASPAPITVTGIGPTVDIIAEWATPWRYDDSGNELGTAWTQPANYSMAWSLGKAPLGWGGSQTTTVGPSKPTTTYYRRSFVVNDPAAVKVATVNLKVSQGAVAYINGVEVGRANMPIGPVDATTAASAWIGGADNNRVTSFVVPGSLLTKGTNVLAVSVHGWRAQSGLTLFDGQLTVTRSASPDTTVPSQPTATATIGAGGTTVGWTTSTGTTVAGYLVSRDGAPVAVVSAETTSYLDATAVSAGRSYTVTAFNAAGTTATSGAVKASAAPTTTAPATTAAATTTTATRATTPAGSTSTSLLAYGSTWRWTYPSTAPASTWASTGFDPAAWSSGRGAFGFGTTTLGTTISAGGTPTPLTSYYRTTIQVTNPSQFRTIDLDLLRDGGAAVYVNGVEVGRSNLPTGPIRFDTYANARPTLSERSSPVRFSVPSSAFVDGPNTIAVELHLGWKSQPAASFDLRATGTR